MFRAYQFMQLLVVGVMTAVVLSPVGTQAAYARSDATTAITWYVAPTGLDSNSCASADAPCLTINAAIGKAASGDTVEVAIGTYMGSGTEVVLIDKDITLSGGWDEAFTAQSALSTIDGQATRRGVTINSGTTVNVDHFGIQNGFNTLFGAGIYNAGILTLTNSVVSNNWAQLMGGGIDNYGTLTVNDSRISSNTAGQIGYSGGGGGGGVQVWGAATFNNTTINGNKIIGSFSGSAIDAEGFRQTILSNSTISDNTGSTAIYCYRGLTLNNTTVSGNSAGGVECDNSVSINNSTITGNASLNGAGLRVYSGPSEIKNSILAGNNQTNGNAADCSGSITSVGYNLIGSNSGCTFTASAGDLVGTAAAPIAPRLLPLGDNGGTTFTHALLPDSPAIGAGNSSFEPGSGGSACLGTDQRGMPRRSLAEGICDMGAYELQWPVVKSITRVDTNPTSATNVNFVVNFSDNVIGVRTTEPFGNFGLTTTGAAGAIITAVSGSGNTYTVTVNSGTGNGTIRLDVIDDDTIQDVISMQPLGGPGAGNGNFVGGQTYIIRGPMVTSITRTDPNPTSAGTVNFTVIFSEPVAGVDTLAPFSDFVMTTTGVAGAAITDVAGSADTYIITVTTGTGSSNGTIRLDLIDDNSIVDAAGRPLGDTAIGDGSFTTGQAYTITRISNPQLPSGTIWDTTPTYKWSKVPQATQYRYQLVTGTTPVYVKAVPASVCSATVCSNTPTTLLVPDAYKWRVQALVGGVWKSYSPYRVFVLRAPKAGYYKRSYSDYAVDFYVTPNRVSVRNFGLWFYVDGCHKSYKLTNRALLPIINIGNFGFTGPFHAYGTFTATTLRNPVRGDGGVGLDSYYIPGCGNVSGSVAWTANWINGTQPAAASIEGSGRFIVTPMLDAPSELLTIDTFTLQP